MWSKKGKRQNPEADLRLEQHAARIAEAIVAGQRQLADWLQRQSNRLSLRQRKYALLLFLFTGVAYYTYSLVVSDSSLVLAPTEISISRINRNAQRPAGSGLTDTLKIRRRLDSLARGDPQGPVKDSVSQLYRALEELSNN